MTELTPGEQLVESLNAEAWMRFDCDWVKYMRRLRELEAGNADLLEALRPFAARHDRIIREGDPLPLMPVPALVAWTEPLGGMN